MRPLSKDLYDIGTTADVLRLSPVREGQRQVIVQGRQRFRILEVIQSEPFLIARTVQFEDRAPLNKDFEARIMHLREQASKALSFLPQSSAELKSIIESIELAPG